MDNSDLIGQAEGPHLGQDHYLSDKRQLDERLDETFGAFGESESTLIFILFS